jgi:dolichol kinase
MNTNSNWFAGLLLIAIVGWIALTFFWPYAAVAPIVIGGIVELIWPYTLREKLGESRYEP